MRYETSAGIIVFYTERSIKKYLLLQYTKGYWDFPKGHLEKEETTYDAALRELQEETSISPSDITLYKDCCYSINYIFNDPYTHKLVKKTVYFFVGQSQTKTVTLSHEHLDYIWLPYRAALRQLTYHNARDVLHYMHRWLREHALG